MLECPLHLVEYILDNIHKATLHELFLNKPVNLTPQFKYHENPLHRPQLRRTR